MNSRILPDRTSVGYRVRWSVTPTCTKNRPVQAGLLFCFYFGCRTYTESRFCVHGIRFLHIKWLFIQLILNNPQCLAKALEMDYLAFSQETQRIDDVRVISHVDKVFISSTGFLLCGKIFHKICDGIAL